MKFAEVAGTMVAKKRSHPIHMLTQIGSQGKLTSHHPPLHQYQPDQIQGAYLLTWLVVSARARTVASVVTPPGTTVAAGSM